MFVSLPWWIIGAAAPNDDVEASEDECDDTFELEKTEEAQSDTDEDVPEKSSPESPKNNSLSFLDAVDVMPQVPTFDMFKEDAKKCPSAISETTEVDGVEPAPKLSKKESSESAKQKKFGRFPTLTMLKTADGEEVLENSKDEEIVVEAETGEPIVQIVDSPVPSFFSSFQNFNDEKDPDENPLNKVIGEDIPSGEESIDEAETMARPRTREYPTFFSSFNDDTVIFNSTIAGDFEQNESQKKDEVSHWVFNNNMFLTKESIAAEVSTEAFRTPAETPEKKIALKRSVKSRKRVVTADEIKKDAVNKEARVVPPRKAAKRAHTPSIAASRKGTPSRAAPPSLETRTTPSRKAKKTINYRDS